MQRSRFVTLMFLSVIFLYLLFSQFYLKALGNAYVYVINPIFAIAIAIAAKFMIMSPYKTTKHKKQILFYIGITLIIYIVVYLLSGLFLTYGKNPYFGSFQGLLLNLYSVGLVIACREYVRYKLVNNVFKKDRILICILTVLVFTFQDIALTQVFDNFNLYSVFRMIFADILPSLTKSILFTYIALYTDCIPAIIFELALYLMQWIPPVLPNAPWCFYAVMDIIFPAILLIYSIYDINTRDREHIYKYKNVRIIAPRTILPTVVIVVLIVWFAIGLFPIKPLGIATGSMEPNLHVGDLVLIQKCSANDIEKGDIIEYVREGYSITHRVVDKYQDGGTYYFITKGDNNNREDKEPVEEDRVIGKTIGRIPYLALPTIWLHNTFANKSDHQEDFIN